MLCSKCKSRRYCSIECQRIDWNAEHKQFCTARERAVLTGENAVRHVITSSFLASLVANITYVTIGDRRDGYVRFPSITFFGKPWEPESDTNVAPEAILTVDKLSIAEFVTRITRDSRALGKPNMLTDPHTVRLVSIRCCRKDIPTKSLVFITAMNHFCWSEKDFATASIAESKGFSGIINGTGPGGVSTRTGSSTKSLDNPNEYVNITHGGDKEGTILPTDDLKEMGRNVLAGIISTFKVTEAALLNGNVMIRLVYENGKAVNMAHGIIKNETIRTAYSTICSLDRPDFSVSISNS